MNLDTAKRLLCALVCASALPLSGCGGGGGGTSADSSVVVGGDFPVAYIERSATAAGEPTDARAFAPGSDLYLLEVGSPSARRINVTGGYTQGAGDVADPEVSYDGRRIVFSMRGPSDPTWNIWEYDVPSGNLRRVIADDAIANQGDDRDPAYLPDGRIVFSSSRQTTTRAQLQEAGIEPYAYQEGYGREPAMVLHVMNPDGSGIEQISFNQSHDRNPTVRMDGRIMFARWDHMGSRNQYPVYTINPDGTGLDIYYGAFSPGEAFVDPRELPDGRLLANLLPLAGTHNGGALVIADSRNAVDNARVLPGDAVGGEAQYQPTYYQLPITTRISPFGRYTSPYPLWDGTERALVAWTPFQNGDGRNPLTGGGAFAEGNPRYGIYMLDLTTGAQRPIRLADAGRILTDPVAVMPRPLPPVLESTLPEEGAEGTAPAATLVAAPRPCRASATRHCGGEPPPPPPPPSDPCGDTATRHYHECGDEPPPDEGTPPPPDDGTPPPPDDGTPPLPDEGTPPPPDEGTPPPPDTGTPPPEPPAPSAVLNIKSVYDTDFLGAMGAPVLAPGEQIPLRADGRADLARLRDARVTTASQRPARFLRVSRALPTPPGLGLDTIGATAFRMQQLLGYAPIEPDGSVKIRVPADTPLSLAVVDSEGRAFQTHTNWLQLRPNEQRTCNGCHASHRGAAPLNQGLAQPGAFEGSTAALSAEAGETMAEARTRHDPSALNLSGDLVYHDVWTDPASAGRAPDPDRTIGYGGLATPAPVNGIINYVDHIQPLWETPRAGGACVSCHGPGSALNLSDNLAPSGRLASYDALTLGPVLRDAEDRAGNVVIPRGPALVEVGGSGNSSRTSYLMEVLFGQELRAERPLTTTSHAGMLSLSERRLLAEWIDLGAPYVNDPWRPGADADGTRSLTELRSRNQGLDPRTFASQVHPVLMNQCAGCHMPRGHSGDIPDTQHLAPDHAPQRFVLTGDREADFAMTVAAANDVCVPAASPLLVRPTGDEHSALAHPRVDRANTPGDRADDVPVLRVGDAGYNALLAWLGSAVGACQ